jgi:predicted protein tyrosine phosphatase
MWIRNVSLQDVQVGRHPNPGLNSMLIQIADPAYGFVQPAVDFKEIHQFEFLDIENPDGAYGEAAITDHDAKHLVNLLTRAQEQGMNVVVHCHMGLCRSGAVCEVGVMMGFEDTGAHRIPNMLVKHKMMQVLGWTYD